MAVPPPGTPTVVVAADGMTATMDVAAGQKLDLPGVHELLRGAGVVRGVDLPACARLATPAARPARVVLARGTPPVAGADATFAPTFEVGLLPGKLRDDGSIDFHERDLVKSVAVGEPLGVLRPATQGRPGARVNGEPLPAEDGRASTLKFGAGVTLAPDGSAKAARAGVIVHLPGVSLDVTDGHVHGADVDLRTGDLKVKGTLSVRGSVARTFGVTATGDVDVRDAVDGGRVHAGGSVRVGGTVRGGGDGIVWGEGDVSLRTAESAVVRAGGTLRVVEAINSQLHGKRVEVARRVRGGSTVAEEALVVQEAGAPDGTDTRLTVGEPLGKSVEDALAAVLAAKRARDAKRGGALRAGGAGGVRDERDARAGRSGFGERDRGTKAGRVQAAVAAATTRDRIGVATRRESLAVGAYVHVAGPVHPGVVVYVGAARLAVDTAVRGVRFALDPETRTVMMERGPK